ncbi:MAG: septum formation initiator family protein [Pseudomonadota bacterium]|nr:septum formation initiator family protein [Pseudomonadota bacterium]MEC8288620.1 septum formation initiator family protein [Pseudomonadota bacterium]MEC8724884.1 septum formation initiator family protein [Pseudomonadota bacterium]MEC9207383.1 septum formation initiator family protein [Pseudomonadota bacterium]
MGLTHEIKRRSRRMLVPTVGALFVSYFLVHAFHGERGILAWMHLQKQVASAKQTLISTKAILGNYKLRISLLKSNHLDADMLDERARVMVGLVGPDEFNILHEKFK